MFRKLALSAAAFVLLASTTISSAQQTGQEPAQDLAPQQPQYSLDSVITLVRANMQADRASVVASAMDLSPKDAPAFWQVYRDYESERARIDDGRVAVIKQYSESYSSLIDAAAKDMALKMIASDARLASVKKKYYKKFGRYPTTIEQLEKAVGR